MSKVINHRDIKLYTIMGKKLCILRGSKLMAFKVDLKYRYQMYSITERRNQKLDPVGRKKKCFYMYAMELEV